MSTADPLMYLRAGAGLIRLLCALLLALAAAGAQAGAPARELLLDERVDRYELWPEATLFADPAHEFSVDEVMARTQYFTPPDTPYANLGTRHDTVWIRVPVAVPAAGTGHWWFVSDYPLLDEIELHIVRDGRVLQRTTMGDHLMPAQRPAPTRPHAVEIVLPPGHSYELLLRVRSSGTLIVPISLMQDGALVRAESRFHLIQGVATGIALLAVLFTLARYSFTREPLLAWFAAATTSATLFMLSYFGIAPLYLWPGNEWLVRDGPPFLMLILLATGALFVDRSLNMQRSHRRSSLVMRLAAVISTLTALVMVFGLVSYEFASVVTAVLGVVPTLIALPVAFVRARAGDRAAYYLFGGWVLYGLGVGCFSETMRGNLPYAGWIPYVFQLASLMQLGAWIMVLGVRAEEIRMTALNAEHEHQRISLIAQTDPLTGLLNRRGLHAALQTLVSGASGRSLTAVFLIDLDAFKPVNDLYGHDAGDRLLVQVADRLRSAVRGDDLVARLGGDEFVVAVARLHSAVEAIHMAEKLLACGRSPFVLAEASCTVGMTIGYALAPTDGGDAELLLRRADEAMYAGKQAGRDRATRVGTTLGIA